MKHYKKKITDWVPIKINSGNFKDLLLILLSLH